MANLRVTYLSKDDPKDRFSLNLIPMNAHQTNKNRLNRTINLDTTHLNN
jgi:hypothetical protein